MKKQKKRPTKVNKDTFPPFSPPITTKPAKSWTAVILMVPVMGMIYAEIYNQVMLNFSSVSYQSGWHFVQVVMQVPIIYVISTVLAALAHSWSRIKISSLKMFFISSQVIMASMWLLIMISVIGAY